MVKRIWGGAAGAAVLAAGMLMAGGLASFGAPVDQAPLPAGQDFRPDWRFSGSGMKGWEAQGSADWKIDKGQVTGTVKSSDQSGWITLDHSYEDVALFVNFKCTGGCKTGVLLRAEKSDGGEKGVFLSLADGDFGFYRATVDANGNVTREPLTPPAPEGASGRGRGAAGPALSSKGRITPPDYPTQVYDVPGQPGISSPRPTANAYTAPRERIEVKLDPDGWNRLQVYVYNDEIKANLNGTTLPGAGSTADATLYGPIAFLVSGPAGAQLAMKDVSTRDLMIEPFNAEHTSPNFREQQLTNLFYTESVAVGDVNHDGIPDVIAGPNYWLGPDYRGAHRIYMSRPLPFLSYPPDLLSFAEDFEGNGWDDVIQVGFPGTPAYFFRNSHGESRDWDRTVAVPSVDNETAVMADVSGSGKPLDLVYASAGYMCWAEADKSDFSKPWIVHHVSEQGGWGAVFRHGVGAGDVNGDGLTDILSLDGWWEHPAKGTPEGPWKFHPYQFALAGDGGSNLVVYDVNGDGLPDVITSIAAHGWGLAWYEQVRSKDGEITFKKHTIVGDFSEAKEHGGAAFSAMHTLALADVDGDGLKDIVTGKRWYGHFDSYGDPDVRGDAVVYWFKLVRKPNHEAEFIPEMVNNRSGIGTSMAAVDLNHDGKADIVTASRNGVFIFFSRAGKAGEAAKPAAASKSGN